MHFEMLGCIIRGHQPPSSLSTLIVRAGWTAEKKNAIFTILRLPGNRSEGIGSQKSLAKPQRQYDLRYHFGKLQSFKMPQE